VVRVNRVADLALLRLEQVPAAAPSVPLAASEAGVGTLIHAIGQGAGGRWIHTLGKVNAVRHASSWYSGQRTLHRGSVLSGKLLDEPGAAGAPLLDNQLRLVGMAAEPRARKAGLLTAVSLDTIRHFVAARPQAGAVAGGG